MPTVEPQIAQQDKSDRPRGAESFFTPSTVKRIKSLRARDPLVAFSRQDPEFLVVMEVAESRVTSTCMTRLGFSFPERSVDQVLTELEEDQLRFYGVGDRAVALQYGNLPRPSSTRQDAARDASKTYQDALLGDTSSSNHNKKLGCLGLAKEKLYEDSSPDQRLMGDSLRVEAFYDALELAESRKAIAAWARCMAKKGHPARTSPLDGLANVGNEDPATGNVLRAKPQQVREAIDDLDCKSQVSLVKTLDQVRITYSKDRIAQHQSRLSADRAELSKIQRGARSYLDS